MKEDFISCVSCAPLCSPQVEHFRFITVIFISKAVSTFFHNFAAAFKNEGWSWTLAFHSFYKQRMLKNIKKYVSIGYIEFKHPLNAVFTPFSVFRVQYSAWCSVSWDIEQTSTINLNLPNGEQRGEHLPQAFTFSAPGWTLVKRTLYIQRMLEI